MNSILEKEFDPYLLPNEAILWVGESKKSDSSTISPEFTFIRTIFTVVIMMFFIMPIFSAIIFMIFGIFSFFLLGINIIGIFGLIVGIAAMIGAFFLIKFFKKKGNSFNPVDSILNLARQGNTIYAMTDKRMLIRNGISNKQLNSIDLERIHSMKLIEHNDNLCSITLMEEKYSRKTGRMFLSVGGMIQGVENGLELYKLLTEYTQN